MSEILCPGHLPAPDNVRVGKICFTGAGVSQTMPEIPYPRAESAPQALAYTHTPACMCACIGAYMCTYVQECMRVCVCVCVCLCSGPDNVQVGKIC